MKYCISTFAATLSLRSSTLRALLFGSATLLACNSVFAAPTKVEIISTDNGYQLLTNNKPFAVNGVGLGFQNEQQVRALKQAGGNSFRTWRTTEIETELALAKELDLMIAVGIDTGKELQGFDYNDQAAVDKQFTRVTSIIEKYKDHPNVLCWVISNEPNLLFDDNFSLIDVNPKVYKALGDIIDYIHKVDANHPVTFTFAGASKSHIDTALKHAPNIDFISVQVYGGLGSLGEAINALNIDKPFMVTEFGPMGSWETGSTSWGREIEEPSGIKAAGMIERMEKTIINDTTGKIIGSFAFLWGQKQERTPTWYGMFNAGGERTARVDELTRIWTGAYPANRAPLSHAITINGVNPAGNLHIKANTKATAKVTVSDPDGDALKTEWFFMQEVKKRSQGGHHEDVPVTLPVKIISTKIDATFVEVEFVTPDAEGEYRLFSYSYDGNNGVANANFPFMVSPE